MERPAFFGMRGCPADPYGVDQIVATRISTLLRGQSHEFPSSSTARLCSGLKAETRGGEDIRDWG